MRNMLCGLMLFAGVAFVTAVRADEEEKVPIDKLPAKVLAAVKDKFAGAQLLGASKEKEKGKEVFEVEIKHKETHIDVTVTPDGSITCIETQIDAKELPKPVARALAAKYPNANYKIIEKIARGDKMTYEILLETADKKKLEVTFDPAGKLVEEEKKDSKP